MILGRKQGDPRVKRILDALELKYSIDSDGDFKVVLEFSDGRSKLLCTISKHCAASCR